MRVVSLERRWDASACELRATVTSSALATPFELWFRTPSHLGRFVDPSAGDALVPALLLPAMKVGEPLEIPVPISARLARATKRIQTIYRCWEPRLSMIEVRASHREEPVAVGDEVGLFYSCGVDSSYSLAKNLIDHPLNEHVITQLISIHGLDVRVRDARSAVYERMLDDARQIGRIAGKGVVDVSTNVQELMQMLGIPWGLLGHGAGLASVGLLLQRMFRTIYVAPGSGSYLWLAPTGSHPLLDPLWSTESLTFIHDGCEATRLERIRLLAKHPALLEKLHVCWNSESPEYNCGACSKCLLLMVGLHIANADGACPTLPASIDLEALRRVRFVISAEVEWCAELIEALDDRPDDVALRAVLVDLQARAKLHFDRLRRAAKTLRRLVPGRERFILVDEEAIREKLGVGIPFMERNGVFAGNPRDSEEAIAELERLRGAGAGVIAFWCDEFWWLDYYADLRRHLEQRYRRIWEDDSLIVFDLAVRAPATANPIGYGDARETRPLAPAHRLLPAQ
jgi:hypothetical protein